MQNKHSRSQLLGASCLAVILILIGIMQPQRTSVSAQRPGDVHVIHDYRHDVSPPVSEIQPPDEPKKPKHEKHHVRRVSQHVDAEDTVVQDFTFPEAMPGPMLNFNGIGFPGVACNCAPPDTNGEVGATQYVQMVNEGFQVWRCLRE